MSLPKLPAKPSWMAVDTETINCNHGKHVYGVCPHQEEVMP